MSIKEIIAVPKQKKRAVVCVGFGPNGLFVKGAFFSESHHFFFVGRFFNFSVFTAAEI